MTANHDQAEHWNNSEDIGHWLNHQARYERMLAPLTGVILDAAALSTGDHVLDVGCGCGATTLAVARVVAPGKSVGIDLSAPMLTRARADAERSGLNNASFAQGDAQVCSFEHVFDAVISRFGTMFFADPVAAFANLRTATRQGGRLVFVCWQPLIANEWLLVPGAALAEPDRLHQILASAGWHDITVTSKHASILVGGGGPLDDIVAFLRTGSIGRVVLAGVDPGAEARALRSVRDALARHADAHGVHLDAAVWLVQARP